jgi:hypothetical protein
MKILKHKFLEIIPDYLEDDILYISVQYKTVVHKCICGCGNEVVTPLTPNDWRLTFDGKTISLYPSIGNWSFKCKSHYWIRNSVIEHVVELFTSNHVVEKKIWKIGLKKLMLQKKKKKKKK